MPGDVLTLGREFKRRFPDQFAGMSAIEVGRQASERLGIDAPDVSRPDRRDLVDTEEYQPVRVAVPGRSAPTTRAAAQPVALRTPNAQEMDQAATQAAQERVEGVRAVARLAGSRLAQQAQPQPPALGPRLAPPSVEPPIASPSRYQLQNLGQERPRLLSPQDVRRQIGRQMAETGIPLLSSVGRLNELEATPDATIPQKLTAAIQGGADTALLAASPGLTQLVGRVAREQGAAGVAKLAGILGADIAAGEAANVGVRSGLEATGVRGDVAELAGTVADIAVDPFAIVGGMRVARTGPNTRPGVNTVPLDEALPGDGRMLRGRQLREALRLPVEADSPRGRADAAQALAREQVRSSQDRVQRAKNRRSRVVVPGEGEFAPPTEAELRSPPLPGERELATHLGLRLDDLSPDERGALKDLIREGVTAPARKPQAKPARPTVAAPVRPTVAKPAPKAEAPTIAKPKPKPVPKVRQAKPEAPAPVEAKPEAAATNRVLSPRAEALKVELAEPGARKPNLVAEADRLAREQGRTTSTDVRQQAAEAKKRIADGEVARFGRSNGTAFNEQQVVRAIDNKLKELGAEPVDGGAVGAISESVGNLQVYKLADGRRVVVETTDGPNGITDQVIREVSGSEVSRQKVAGSDSGVKAGRLVYEQADESIPPDPAGRGGFLRIEPRGREQAAAVGLGPNQPPQRPTISGALAKVRAEVKAKAQAIAKRADSQEFRTQLIDRTAPIQDFVETARRSGKLNPEADPGQSARLYAGAGARAEAKLDQLDEIIRPVRRDMDAALELAVFERFDELAKRGVKKFPNGMTPLEVNAGMQRIRAEIAANPNRQRRINRFLTQVRDYQNGILDELAREGIISAAGRDAIRASNEKYIPLQRIGFLADDFAKHGQPRRFSVSSQDVVQSIVGSEREIIDPLESIVRNTYKATNLIARNRVAREMFELSKLPEYQGEILPLKRGQDPPRGFDTVTYLRDGEPVRYAVPSPVAAAMKNIGAVQADIITKIARLPTQSLRLGTVVFNLPFIPSNLRRDFETMGVTQGMGMLESAQTWASGLSEVIGGGRYFDEWRDSGGAFSGLFESLKTPQRSAKHLRRSQADRAIRKMVNPLELVRVMGEIAEQAPRVGVFKRARVKLGEGPRQAALRARDATVDFNRVGQTTAVVNQWLPFVNARLQGNLNLGKAFTDPKRRGRAMLSASQLVLAPAVATYLYNVTQHEDAYNEISDFEKQNNFVIVLGDEKDARDRLTNVIKIPKGDVGRVLGNPIESFLDYLRYRDPMAFDSLAVQVLSDVSPVSFERDGEWSTNRLLSDLTPPIFKGPLEVSLNRNLFTGREIVPRNRQGASPPLQRRFDTPSAAVAFGEFFNVSPLKVEHIIRSSFGGVGEQALMLASGQPERIGEQFERRFSSALARESTDQAFEEAGEFKRLEEDRRVAAELEAQTLFESIKDLPPAQKKAGFQQAVAKIAERDPAHAARVVREFEGEVKRAQMTAFERYMRYSMPVAARADWIEAQIGRIQDPAQQGAFLRDLEQKKILSKAVQDELRKRRQPNGRGAPN